MILKIAFVLAVMAAGILLYGYWHAASHATLHVWLQDGTEGSRHQPVLEAELSFMDASGRVVAKARSEALLGVVYLSERCHRRTSAERRTRTTASGSSSTGSNVPDRTVEVCVL